MAKRRFYRPPPPLSKLARIVWSPRVGKAIAEFGKDTNQFFTDREEVAAELLDLGYLEVGLEDEVPPYVPEMTVTDIGDVKINPKGYSEDHEVRKQARTKLLNDSEPRDDLPPIPEKKTVKGNEKAQPPKSKKVVKAATPKSKPPVKKAPAKTKKMLKRRPKKEV